MTTMKATAVFPLSEGNLDVLKAMQVRFIDEIPEGAKFLAFLEDGDACFLESIDAPPRTLTLPKMRVINYYDNIVVEL